MSLARPWRALALVAAGVMLAACQHHATPVAFHAQHDPKDLSAWHVLRIKDGYLKLNQGVMPYGVNAKLFANYALKLRTVWMPKGKSAHYKASGPFEFPAGTIISKTFYYPLSEGKANNGKHVALTYDTLADYTPGRGIKLADVRLIETRLLVHRKDGWHAMTYVWNAGQTAAHLRPTGALDDLTGVGRSGKRHHFTYVVPSQAQCAICHDHTRYASVNDSTHYLVPIGPTAAHLNRDFAYAEGKANQLRHWARAGYLKGLPTLADVPRDADWLDTSQPLAARARSYLDANCAYCHNPNGQANYTSLWLTANQRMGMHTGLCKTPVAAGKATGGRLFDIVPGEPDASILPHRLRSTDVGIMMPELGRTLSDRKGVQLVRAWIGSLKGECAIVRGESAAAP